jgi:hypothetical protein
MTTTTDVDINSIAYDAPLAFKLPLGSWVQKKSLAGTNWTTFSADQVPGKDLTGKWIIISGGNNGIGREAALRFADWGANLILACREPPPHESHPNAVVAECRQRANAAGHEKSQIEWWEVNYADLASVKAFAMRWLETGRPLDILWYVDDNHQLAYILDLQACRFMVNIYCTRSEVWKHLGESAIGTVGNPHQLTNKTTATMRVQGQLLHHCHF